MAVKEKKKAEPTEKNVRVNPSEFVHVKKYCDEKGVKISWFYSEAARIYLNQLSNQ